jgi:alkylation response protein AidB-like acyl-CoA dehydrogenase
MAAATTCADASQPVASAAAAGTPVTVTIRTADEAVAAARAYAESIGDGAIRRDRLGEVPYSEFTALDASGLLAITVPRAYGGPELGATVLAEVIRTIAIAQAKAFGSEVAAEVTTEMFALSGASATDEKYDLSRHWRNARTHASHDPVSWKYHHIGNYLLNDALPPNEPRADLS